MSSEISEQLLDPGKTNKYKNNKNNRQKCEMKCLILFIFLFFFFVFLFCFILDCLHFPQYHKFDARLQTFVGWPHQDKAYIADPLTLTMVKILMISKCKYLFKSQLIYFFFFFFLTFLGRFFF
jgi:hypothetical protein